MYAQYTMMSTSRGMTCSKGVGPRAPRVSNEQERHDWLRPREARLGKQLWPAYTFLPAQGRAHQKCRWWALGCGHAGGCP